ncbi:MAG: hypothetical protein OK454_03935, partial [Thaumarchaeota archaeon]|nr:hypothetical protein [Nitrososphaerota archaeon]
MTMNGSAGSDRPALGKKQRTESAKQLPRRARAYSFETGRNDSINVSRKRSKKGKHASAPPPPPMRAMTNADLDEEKMLGPLAGHVFPRVPTLHASKRDGQHLMPRKKSSKRRRRDAHDREREAELKAMSNFVPLRPATDSWTAGRPMRKESKRVLTGLGFGGTAWRPWAREIRTSVISLPMAESMDSALSSDSDQISYKISALDAFAPKPTLRYATCPSWFASLRNDGTGPPRTPSLRKKPSEPIPGSSLGAHKRIDELADNLSAGDLRELMERDQRRREQQRQTEQERAERRLARRAEKQRAAEEQARESGQEPPQNLERGVAGREMVGLGIDPTSAIVTSSRRRSSGSSPKQPGRQPAVDDDDEEPDRKGRASPLDSFHRTDSIDLEEPLPAPAKEPEDPVVPPVPQRPKTRTSWGLLRSAKTRTNSPPLSNREQPEVDRLRKGSESSSSKGHKSWTFIFKWNSKSKRASGGPSSFSNTSRDSMATQPQPAAPVTYVPARKINPAVPKRTLSRFREDLPETPISPPDSRMQSPDAEPL